jgi:hypothetical protein
VSNWILNWQQRILKQLNIRFRGLSNGVSTLPFELGDLEVIGIAIGISNLAHVVSGTKQYRVSWSTFLPHLLPVRRDVGNVALTPEKFDNLENLEIDYSYRKSLPRKSANLYKLSNFRLRLTTSAVHDCLRLHGCLPISDVKPHFNFGAALSSCGKFMSIASVTGRACECTFSILEA